MSENIQRFLRLCGLAELVFTSEASWEFKYDRIFDLWNKDIRPILLSLNDDLDWCDPDSTYEADIKAFMEALSAKKQSYLLAYTDSAPNVRYSVNIEYNGQTIATIVAKQTGDLFSVEKITTVKESEVQHSRLIDKIINAMSESFDEKM